MRRSCSNKLLVRLGEQYELCRLLILATLGLPCSCLAAEYSVEGVLSQTIIESDRPAITTSAAFTVFVRDCAWLIQTIETNQLGRILRRETGSTNGAEIFELQVGLSPPEQSPMSMEGKPRRGGTRRGTPAVPRVSVAKIVSNSVPVGQVDTEIVGHLWLMFASRCYWNDAHRGQLTPVFDWRASVAAHGEKRRVMAEWDLLAGTGSLPREVRYLGQWGETNGLYTITTANSVGGMLIPNGFVFEERHVGPIPDGQLVHSMVLRKRVEASVTSVRPVCSKVALLPLPEERTIVVDRRVAEDVRSTRPPFYGNPVAGEWVSADKAKELVEATKAGRSSFISNRQHSTVVVVLLCGVLLAPLALYGWWRSKKQGGKN